MCLEVWCGLQSETCAKFSLSSKCILNCVLPDKVRDVGRKLKFGCNLCFGVCCGMQSETCWTKAETLVWVKNLLWIY